MPEIPSTFYDSEYYKMQTSKELTDRTLPFILSIPFHGKVLEIGCGSGQYLEIISRKGLEYIGVDYSEVAVEICRNKGLNVISASADSIPIDDKFDFILLIDVVEHLTPTQFKGCIKEVDRLLKNGGIVAVKTPCKDIIPKSIRKWYNHIRGFGEPKYGEGHVNEMSPSEVVESFGYPIERIDIINTSKHQTLNKMMGYRLGGRLELLLRK